jgi:LysB family phage lysis regulatory protein
MNVIVARMGGVALVLAIVAAIAAAVLHVRNLHGWLIEARSALRHAGEKLDARDQIIRQLRDDAERTAEQQRALAAKHNAIVAKLAAARQKNRSLLHENAALRAWGDTPVPDNIARLHIHPTLTGAGDYLAKVPDGDALHAAGDGAAHERRSQ